MAGDKICLTLYEIDARLVEQCTYTFPELFDDFFFLFHDFGKVEWRSCSVEGGSGKPHLSIMGKTFGRDASCIETGSSGLGLLDDGYLQTILYSIGSGSVTTWSRTDYQ